MIQIESGPRTGSRLLLRAGEKFVFGRSERADILITDDLQLSSCHFRVSLDQSACFVEDLHSTNGTWVNDQKISKHRLCDGDRVRAGRSVFRFEIDARDAYLRDAWVPIGTSNPDPEPRDQPSGALPEEDIRGTEVERRSKIDRASRAPPEQNRPSSSSSHDPSDQPPLSEGRGDVSVTIQQCRSGLFRAEQTTQSAKPDVLVDLLECVCPATFIIDFSRSGIRPVPPTDEGFNDYLLGSDSSGTSGVLSPRMLRARDVRQRNAWINSGWGSDGMIVLFSHANTRSLLKHFQSMMGITESDVDAAKGDPGLCWPGVLRTMLNDGKADLVALAMDPFEAILVESPDASGGWSLLGDRRMPRLLTNCLVSHSYKLET